MPQPTINYRARASIESRAHAQWPALNYYAAKDSVILFEYEDGGVWWSAWYTKWGVGLGIAGLGYSVKKWLED